MPTKTKPEKNVIRYKDNVLMGLITHVPSTKGGLYMDRATLTGWIENGLIEVKLENKRTRLVSLQSILR